MASEFRGTHNISCHVYKMNCKFSLHFARRTSPFLARFNQNLRFLPQETLFIHVSQADWLFRFHGTGVALRYRVCTICSLFRIDAPYLSMFYGN